jgi:hypothetical protein
MDFETTVDLNEVKRVIEAPEFAQYLLSHTVTFGAAAFILQTLLDAVDKAAQQVDNTENI